MSLGQSASSNWPGIPEKLQDVVYDFPLDDDTIFNQYFSSHVEFLQSISPHVKDVVYKRNDHFVAVAPKGLATNIVMDMAVLRAMSLPKTSLANVSGHLPTNARCKILFISSLQERYQQRLQEWKLKYESILLPGWSRALKVGELSESTISHYDIFCTTPSQFDAFCRRFLVPLTPQAAQELSSFGLVLIEDIHLVGTSQEGLRLEVSVVSRLKMLSKLPDMANHMLSNLRFGGTVDSEWVSPTAISTIRTWINATLTNVCFADNAGEPAASGCLSLPLHNVTTLIKGYPSSANEFLFDRRLNDSLWPLVKEYGRHKSVVILCTSRNSAMEAALALVDNVVAAAQELKTPQKGNVGQNEFSWHPGSMYWTNRPSVLVRDQSHWETLQRAALKMENLELKRLVPHGIGFLHAGMSLGDKCLMKALFESGDLRILCCTAPPSLTHAESARQLLIILKGTKRYVNSYKATETAGYSEADGYAVINIIREAAVRLFCKSLPALAIVMTEQKNVQHYQALLQSPKSQEQDVSSWIIRQSKQGRQSPDDHSQIITFLSECLCNEICIGTVTDNTAIHDWLGSLLFPLFSTTQPLSITDLQNSLIQRLIYHPPVPLIEAIPDYHCGMRVYPRRGGTILSKYGLCYDTMMAIMRLSQQNHQNMKSLFIEYSYEASHPSHLQHKGGDQRPKAVKQKNPGNPMIEDILWLISSSPEVLEDCKVTIRRNEKQALNAMNAAPGQLYRMTKAVHKAVNGPENKITKPSKRLPRITTASQKVFVLLAHIMSTNRLHQSTRQLQGTRCSGQSDQSALRYDLARVSKAAGRMVAAIAEYYSDKDFGDSNQTTATLHRAACTVLEALTLGQGEQ